MLLSKIPCLDKGYVALIDSSNTSTVLNSMRDEYFGAQENEALYELSTLTLVLRCPLFIQLNLSKFNLKIITAKDKEVEAYLPNAGEVGSPSHDTNTSIADNIMRTTEALLMNPKAYQADGCDRFMSQVISPINVYVTLIVHGSYNEWKRYCKQTQQPAPVKSYTNAVEQILNNEWKR